MLCGLLAPGAPAVLGIPWFTDTPPNLGTCCHVVPSGALSVPLLCFIRSPGILAGPIQMTSSLLDPMCKDTTSKLGHSHRD